MKKLITFFAAFLLSACIIMPTEEAVAADAPAESSLSIQVSYAGGGQTEETFGIRVTPKDGAPLPKEGETQEIALSEHKSKGELTCSFSFAEEGDYVYEIVETPGNTEGITYDNAVYTVSFTVFASDGALHPVMRVTKKGETETKPDGISFVNSYAGGSIIKDDPPVRKVVLGTDRTDPFVFVLTPIKADNPMPDTTVDGVCKVTIEGSGEEEFGVITFTTPGVYEYEAVEQQDGIEGYTYDKSTYRVVYTITDAGNGTLSKERVFLKENERAEECVFTNTYQKGRVTPSVTPGTTRRTSGGNNATNTSGSAQKGGSSTNASSVKTGDGSHLIWYAALFAAAAALIIVLLGRQVYGHAS